MTIRPRYRSNNTLPPAKLYLDDVERIVEILRASVPESISRPGPYGAEAYPAWASFRFVTDDNECDSIDELKDIGGVSHDLRVIGKWFDLRIDRDMAAITAVGREGLDQELRGRLLPIFDARRKRAPLVWFLSGGFLLFVFCSVVVLWDIFVPKWATPMLHSYSPHTQGALRVAIGVFPVILYVLLTLMAMAGVVPQLSMPYSTVVRRYRRDPLPDSARWIPQKHELIKIILTGLLGWVLGLVTVLFFQRK